VRRPALVVTFTATQPMVGWAVNHLYAAFSSGCPRPRQFCRTARPTPPVADGTASRRLATTRCHAPSTEAACRRTIERGTMTQIGIIGAGFMGGTHARAARGAGASLKGVATSNAAGAEQARSRLGAEVAYPSVEDMLADPTIEVVHVCSPNAAHPAHALAALGAGKHVICEKPLATEAADATRLAAAATKAGLIATVPFVYRFHPMAREAQHRTAGSGRIFAVSGSYLQDWLALPSDDDWRTDPIQGGASRAFADIGSHLVDLVEFITRDQITAVHALTRTVHRERGGHPVYNEDIAALLVIMASGAVGTLLVSQVAGGRKNALSIEVHAAEGSIRFDQEQPETLWLGARGGTRIVPRDPAVIGEEARRLSIVPAGHPMGYLDAFTAFVADTYAAVAGNRPHGLPTFADGARAALITEAVLRSAKSRAWEELRPAPS
jgi:predicted dehydrogenase